MTLRLADIVSWRDTASRAAMRIGRVAPDWAFAVGSPDSALGQDASGRRRLAVSIRYNGQQPDADWIRNLRALARTLDLSVVVVAQILRDGPLAEQLAEELGGEALVWDGPDHATQEEKLRSVYRESLLVVTNRLHAAVMALTEGAVPLALGDPSARDRRVPDKVTRTLAAVGIAGVTVDRHLADSAELERTARDALRRRDQILNRVVDARSTLRRLAADIRGLTS
jgi:polysaccharide pyruvyl transferase WcaK-like protein